MLLHYIFALCVTFGLLAVLAWAAQRYGPMLQTRLVQRTRLGLGQTTGTLKVLESLPLTPTHTLHRIQAGPTEHLLVTHPQGTTTVAQQAAGQVVSKRK